ncbi:response regulator [Indioceanicola profundi]|uniref:response regulator n=1 Tax=Indioceanicola profundi TaxID=2220096 RepID=UPI000E6AE067|nr:response regulator [Indioceanicola profundi]
MSDMTHLLVVDDDREIRDLLTRYLSRHGYRVTAAKDGQEMRKYLADRNIDLIVLDLMMPGEDGLSLCRSLRAEGGPPVVMLSAMGEDADRILGLEIGADDYLPKPFNPRELVARIKAVLRRSHVVNQAQAAPSGSISFCGFILDQAQRRLSDATGAEVVLTAGEYELLVALASRPRRVLSRDDLLEITRGRSAGPFDRSIDVQISRLRRKIEPDPADPTIIKTVRSGGYIFSPEVQTL